MKMFLGNTPIKSLNIHQFEMDTNDASLQPSDMQAGVTAYAKGKKVVGTGKCFEFASYGGFEANDDWFIPTETINVIQISSVGHLIKTLVSVTETNTVDFSTTQIVGMLVVDNVEYPISVQAKDNILTISCEQQVRFQVFYGKDRYV